MAASSGDAHPDRMSGEQLRKRDDEILRLFVEEGLSPEGLAARFGLRPSAVHGILRHRGVSLRRLSSGAPPHHKERNDEMARLRAEEGLTLKEIGERSNLGKERVCKVLIKAGVSRG
jgi:DNA-binding CsgD family transcriptional regulator